jgi:hypothetical protein
MSFLIIIHIVIIIIIKMTKMITTCLLVLHVLVTKFAWNRATVLAPRAAYWQNRQYAALGAKSL